MNPPNRRQFLQGGLAAAERYRASHPPFLALYGTEYGVVAGGGGGAAVVVGAVAGDVDHRAVGGVGGAAEQGAGVIDGAADRGAAAEQASRQIGRASCRERV